VGLIGPDEPRYAQVAREMLRTRDFITPHLNGEPWFEKPPLYYWLASACFAALGVNETAARLPAALAAALFLVLFGWGARRLFPGETARYALLVLLCSAGWVAFARAASMEMLFSGAGAGALLLLGLWLWRGRESALYGCYALLAISVLAKGPTDVLLAALVLAAYCAATREWRRLPGVLRPGPLLLFAIIAVPWYAAVYFLNGANFLRVFFWQHHVMRFVTEELQHPGAWWYYLPVLLGLVFPWTAQLALIVLNLVELGRTRLLKDPRIVFLAVWVAVPLVFFSVSKGKLPGYVLVILPALALWIGHEIARASAARMRWTFVVQGLLMLLIPLGAGALPAALSGGLRSAPWPPGSAGIDPLLAAVAVVGGVLLMVLAWRGRRLAACLLTTVMVATMIVRIVFLLAPEIDRLASARTLAREVRSRGISPAELTLSPGVRRQTEYGLDFYLDYPVTRGGNTPYEVTPDDRIAMRPRQPPGGTDRLR
jgi:4-amino-4-deoxy-L-arabinose transferase-like glycosyltransferase